MKSRFIIDEHGKNLIGYFAWFCDNSHLVRLDIKNDSQILTVDISGDCFLSDHRGKHPITTPTTRAQLKALFDKCDAGGMEDIKHRSVNKKRRNQR